MEGTMTFSDAIKTGINTVNKNWMLVIINTITMMVSMVGFAIIVIVPVVVLLLIIGADSVHSFENLDPQQLFALFDTKYLGLALFFGVLVAIYSVFVMAAMLFLYGASSGIIAKSISNNEFVFSFNSFMSEGKRLFTPMLGFTSLTGFLAIVILAVVVAVFFIFSYFSYSGDVTAGLAVTFIKYLFVLIMVTVAFFMFNCTLALTFYGSAALAFNNVRIIAALKDSFRVMVEAPITFWFFLFTMFLLFSVKMLLMLITILMSAIPLIGVVFGFTLNLAMPVIFIYLTYIFMASLFAYYYDKAAFKTDTVNDETLIEHQIP
ncbi:MAG: hypothetical protein H7844_15475 [Nitrospirae bacterium YQR-1]